MRIGIAGAGCSGLSAAAEIVARMPNAEVVVFDPAAEPAGEKTWCYWATREHRFAEAVSERWTRVRVRGGGHDSTVDVSPTPYECVRGSDFFTLAASMLDGSGRCAIRRGNRVAEIEEAGSSVVVHGEGEGGCIEETFDLVLDARPPEMPRLGGREPVLYQHFGGIEIASSGGRVDPDVATLMDFDVDQREGLHFMYVLPFSRGTALFESTFMTASVDGGVDYEAHALRYAREEMGLDEPRVVYRERGVLPMTMASMGPAATRRVWPIGTRGGVARASSGYAFAAIQADSRRLVDAIIAERPRPSPPRSGLIGALDRVLISWLASDGSVGGRVFGGMFARTPTERLVRFLADEPRAADVLATMWAMPKCRTAWHATTTPSAWPR